MRGMCAMTSPSHDLFEPLVPPDPAATAGPAPMPPVEELTPGSVLAVRHGCSCPLLVDLCNPDCRLHGSLG
jgi:hypothetical protein